MAKGRKPAKGGARGSREEDSASSSSDEDAKRPTERRVGAQRSTVGMMPPSDSESESDEEDDAPAKPPAGKGSAKPTGQPATAGTLPPNDSDEEDSDESDDDDEAAAPTRCVARRTRGRHLAAACCESHCVALAPPQLVQRGSAARQRGSAALQRGSPRPPSRPRREKRAVAPEEKSPAEVAAELAKLELVRKRRADQASQRIAAEGFDRFAKKD